MENAIEIITDHTQFPALLREIPDPPRKLWTRGNRDVWSDPHTRFLCVVGSRKATDYGTLACEHIIEGLRGHNITIISGLALGIDSVAHRTALKAGLRTIAVPGSGLDWDTIYPPTHTSLARSIIEHGGALLSVFPPIHHPRLYDFPKRNRIMAGMSHAVLVIEAEERSGSLITARLATDYNRDVGVVPGSIFSRSTAGPHMLARLGATPVRGSIDVLDMLGIEIPPVTHADSTPTSISRALYDNLTPHEKIIFKLLDTPLSRNDLTEKSGLTISEISVALSSLEIRKFVDCRGGIVTRTVRVI